MKKSRVNLHQSSTATICSKVAEKARSGKSYKDSADHMAGQRLALIDGKLCKMTGPSPIHQSILGRIYYSFYIYLFEYAHAIYCSPINVFLQDKSKAGASTIIHLQPDVCVICNCAELDGPGCLSAPDLVVEVFSIQDTPQDRSAKYQIYQKLGVKEYWLVDIQTKEVKVWVLHQDGKYHIEHFNAAGHGIISSSIFKGLHLQLQDIFQ